jgi:hypothetical protein
MLIGMIRANKTTLVVLETRLYFFLIKLLYGVYSVAIWKAEGRAVTH